MGRHMVRIEGDMRNTTMMLNSKPSFVSHSDFEYIFKKKQQPKNQQPKNSWVLPNSTGASDPEFRVVNCCIILKVGHYLCIVFISYFCQPQNVKQSVIAGIMGQKHPPAPTSTGLPGCQHTRKWFSLLAASKQSKNRREIVSWVLTAPKRSGDERDFCLSQFAASSWLARYSLLCQPVDYSSSPLAMRVSALTTMHCLARHETPPCCCSCEVCRFLADEWV